MSDRFAQGLVARGAQRGEVVALLYPTCAELVTAFFGTLKAGSVPTILALPFFMSPRFADNIRRVALDAGVRLLVLSESKREELADRLPQLQLLTTEELVLSGATRHARSSPVDGYAVVQYTSGSTSHPKGVALTHENVLAGVGAIVDAIGLDHTDVNGQWVPLYHDMGLIGFLAGIRAGVEQHLWTPSEFLRRPLRWLQSFAAVRATIYAGPSFGYAYLLGAIDAEAAASIDLSRWRVAFNGSEQVDPQVLASFQSRFAASGLRSTVMRPVYGLAEATLAVTIPATGSVPRVSWVDRGLGPGGRVVERASDDPRARGVVSVGQPVKDMQLRVSSDEGARLPERHVGEIQVKGPSVMHSYFRRPREPANFTSDGWLRTGDLGYLDAGALFVTGRIRELIVLRGENYYPQDLESVVQSLDGIHAGRCVAFAHTSSTGDSAVVLAESALATPDERLGLLRRAQAKLGSELGLPRARVGLLPINSIARTTSGKMQRLTMQARFASGELREVLELGADYA